MSETNPENDVFQARQLPSWNFDRAGKFGPMLLYYLHTNSVKEHEGEKGNRRHTATWSTVRGIFYGDVPNTDLAQRYPSTDQRNG